MRRHRKLTGALAVLGAGGLLAVLPPGTAGASSHREAPLISQDPVADNTDLYAFVSPDRPDAITFVMNVNPLEEPAGGPNFARFGDDVLYTLNLDTNGDARPDIQYNFRFSTTVANPKTFLYNTNQVTSNNDPDLNVKQTYSVTRTDWRTHRWGDRKVIATGVPVAPANVGIRSTPDYEKNLGQPAVKSLPDGSKVFAGPRADPFFVDLGAIFDLGGLRPFNQAHLIKEPIEQGKNTLVGKNVHSIALQVPTSELVKGDPVIGVWETTSRRAVRVLGDDGQVFEGGRWVQVSRLGMPLVNEVVVPIGKKDRFNGSKPQDDAQFADAVLHPELGGLIPVLYPGVQVPTSVDAGLHLGGREDLATIFLTGIPGVNQPAHVQPAEMLRLNTSSAKSAFPNGRWLTDDVVDTSIRAVAGATPFSPQYNVAPNNLLGDGVDAPAKAVSNTFPYVSAPYSGYDTP